MSERIFNKYKKIWGAFWFFVLIVSNFFIIYPQKTFAADPTPPFSLSSFKYNATTLGEEEMSEIKTDKSNYTFRKIGFENEGVYDPLSGVRNTWCLKFGHSCEMWSNLGLDYEMDLFGESALGKNYNIYLKGGHTDGPGENEETYWAILTSKEDSDKSNGILVYAVTKGEFDWDVGKYPMKTDWVKINWISPINAFFQNSLSNQQSIKINNAEEAPVNVPKETISIKGKAINSNPEKGEDFIKFFSEEQKINVEAASGGILGELAASTTIEECPEGKCVSFSGTFEGQKGGTYKLAPPPADANFGSTTYLNGSMSFKIDDQGIIEITSTDKISIASPISGKSYNESLDFYLGMSSDNKGVGEELAEDVLGSWFDTAMNKSMEFAVKGLNVAIGGMMTIIMEAVEGGNEVAQINGVREVIKGVRNLALGLLTLGLLIIAFANIIGIDIEKYGVNRMIPRMVIAVIGVFFSLLICQGLLEVSTALTKMLLTTTNTDLSSITEVRDKTATILNSLAGGLTGSNGFQVLFIVLLLLGLLLVCIWLGVLLLVRKIMIMFLVCVAPAAFIMSIMPFTENIYKDWWKRFLTWAFMGPSIAFFIAIGNEFLLRGFITQKYAPNGIDLLQVDEWSFLILTAVCWGIAAFVPLTLGKEIYGKITGPAKKLAGAGLKMAGISDALGIRKANIAQRQKARGFGLANRVAQSSWGQKNPFLRQMITGADEKQVGQMGNTAINERTKAIEEMNMPKKDAQQYWRNATGPERIAAGRFLASKGWYEEDDQRDYTEIAKDMDDPIIAAQVAKEQPQLLAGLHSSHLLYGTPISSQPQRVPAGGGAPISRVDFEKEASKAVGKALAKIEDLTHHQTSLLQRTTEGQAKLNGLISNQEKVKALNEKGRDRTVAAIGKYIERLEAATPGTIDRMSAGDPTGQHKRVLEDIVRRYHEYQTANPGDSNPDHEIT